jgi:DNA-directed RNA polymerase specialized sigma24 family protein
MDVRADAEFTEFMLGCWQRLVRLGYALTGDLGLAEDLAQTALARAYASWPRVRRAGEPDAYVRKIVVHASRDRFRKRRVDEVLTVSPPEPQGGDQVGGLHGF